MELRWFLILFFSHWIGDFVVQSQWIREQRFPRKDAHTKKTAYNMIWKGNLLHGLCHFITVFTLLLLNHALQWQVAGYVITYVVSHFIIDLGKSLYAYKKRGMDSNLYVFIIDQCLHLVIFLAMFYGDMQGWLMGSLEDMALQDRILLGGSIVVIATFFAGTFIKIYMNYLDLHNPSSKESKEMEVDGEIRRGGYLIGILERSFILSAMVMELPQLIGFMLGVKTIVRLKKMSKDKFAEYFLIGNLLSFLFAILGGVVLKYIWG